MLGENNYYTNFINENSGDQRKFFRASRSLLHPHTDDFKLANEMGTFFVKKIKNIRLKLSDENCSPPPSAPVSSAPVALATGVGEVLTEFNQLSEISVRKLILNSSKKCCILDPIPPKLLIDSLDVLLPVITKLEKNFSEYWSFSCKVEISCCVTFTQKTWSGY